MLLAYCKTVVNCTAALWLIDLTSDSLYSTVTGCCVNLQRAREITIELEFGRRYEFRLFAADNFTVSDYPIKERIDPVFCAEAFVKSYNVSLEKAINKCHNASTGKCLLLIWVNH